jgi:hypothetical protein
MHAAKGRCCHTVTTAVVAAEQTGAEAFANRARSLLHGTRINLLPVAMLSTINAGLKAALAAATSSAATATRASRQCMMLFLIGGTIEQFNRPLSGFKIFWRVQLRRL